MSTPSPVIEAKLSGAVGDLAKLQVGSPEALAAMRQATAAHDLALELVVDSPEMFELAANELAGIRTRRRAIEAQRVHMKEPFLEGGRRIDAFFREPLERLDSADKLIASGLVRFKDAEDRKALEARQEAERQAKAERQEAERLQREADAAAEAARAAEEEAARAEAQAAQEAADAAAKPARDAAEQAEREAAQERARLAREESARVAAAASAEAVRLAEAARVRVEEAEVAAPMVVASAAQSTAVSGRQTWKAVEIDKAALVIAAGKAAEAGDESMLAFLTVNESALNKVAGGMKASTRVPGVTFRAVTTLATRGAR